SGSASILLRRRGEPLSPDSITARASQRHDIGSKFPDSRSTEPDGAMALSRYDEFNQLKRISGTSPNIDGKHEQFRPNCLHRGTRLHAAMGRAGTESHRHLFIQGKGAAN